MPGYWRAPRADAPRPSTTKASTAPATPCDGSTRHDPQRGLLFDGRIAEDFKLSTGTFVSVGPLRARIIAAGDPCVQDAVITGLNRDEVGALIFPRPTPAARWPALRRRHARCPRCCTTRRCARFFQAPGSTALWRDGTGSANRVARLHVLAEPPSIDKGEVTDKGSINQRAVLTHRAALVEALYEGGASDPFLILPDRTAGIR